MHHVWGGLPHQHWNGEVKIPRKRDCSMLHWYCYKTDCACGGNPNAGNTTALMNKVTREALAKRQAVAA